MLSRILSGKDAAHIDAPLHPMMVPHAASSHNDAGAPADVPNANGGAAAAVSSDGYELQALRDQVKLLHAEIGVSKADSLESGRRQGEQQARAELAPVIERLNASIVEITSLRPEIRRRAEKDVVHLSLLIAKRVLHREITVDPNALTALARVAFERMARAESWRLTVHPGFAAAIRNALPAGHTGTVQIEPDPSCLPGTLIIRSEEGVIDASVDSQLDEISRGLTDRLSRS